MFFLALVTVSYNSRATYKIYIMHMYLEIHVYSTPARSRRESQPRPTRHILHTYIHIKHCLENWDGGLKSLLQLATCTVHTCIYMYKDNSLEVDYVLPPEEYQLILHYRIPSPGARNSTVVLALR